MEINFKENITFEKRKSGCHIILDLLQVGD